MRLAFGSDHAGYELRKALEAHATELRHDVVSLGATSKEPFDYPDASDLVAHEVLVGSADLGVLICGTGIGVSIRANRYKGIRAAVCCSTQAAELARQHNHANVLCLGARMTSDGAARQILSMFLNTGEDHSERHERRVQELDRDSRPSPDVEE